ncbi:condensation domain-containing protein [Vibrio sp. AND4]|uniref:condensation domain-containing protein n=1 Tax=Vibrio sp. AND4 TaxID=314289 RepID=UPI00015EFA65|nr:condensation domain-containing protein [Vibrio sp. AND4]EDP60186.1 non ribosomal peptide synthetase BasB [Vibrio sp. AND4]
MYNVTKETKNRLSITEAEEIIWMQQQQEPESIEWSISAYIIDNKCKNEVAIAAFKKLAITDLELNLRYGFSEDFELEKWLEEGDEKLSNLIQARIEQVPELVKKLKMTPWVPENEPPFRMVIVETETKKYLFNLYHPILENKIKDLNVIDSLKKNYNFLNNELLIESFIKESVNISDLNSLNKNSDNIKDIILTEFRTSLNDQDIELDDDFFEVGGHSLLATRIIGNLMNNHGIEISFNDFFKFPSAETLADCASLNQSSSSAMAAVKQDRSSPRSVLREVAPLSFAQEFLWDAHVATGKCAIFNLPFAMRFDAEVDEKAFKLAFLDLIIRHSGLRTLFADMDGSVVQQVIEEQDLPNYEWFWDSSEVDDASLESEAAYVFDLGSELPLRVRFFRDQKTGQQILSFLIHHMVIDEWSLNNLMTELSQAYLARMQNLAPIWDKPALAIRDYATVQRERGVNAEDLGYWVERLQGATPGLEIANSDVELHSADVNPIEAHWVEIDLGAHAHDVVSSIARVHNSSIFSVVYSAIAQALHEEGDLKDLVIGTSASGRDDAKYFDSVGYFTTMVAHRVMFKPEQPFVELVKEVTQTINDSMSHATVPIDRVQRELGLDPKNGLLFDVYAQIHADNALYGSLAQPDGDSISYQQILPNKTESLFALQFEMMENVVKGERTLRLIVTYQTARYSAEQIASIGQKVKGILSNQTVPMHEKV